MSVADWMPLVVIAGCAAALWLLARRSFALAVKIDGRLLGPVSRLPAWWQKFLAPVSVVLRPRYLGLVLAAVTLTELTNGHRRQALFGVLVLAGMAGMEILKLIFKRPRPRNEFVRLHKIKSLSFPSGHAGSALLFFLGVAHLAQAGWLLTAAFVALGLLVGFSRIYLRVHHPSDVFGAWILAIGWFAAMIAVQIMSWSG